MTTHKVNENHTIDYAIMSMASEEAAPYRIGMDPEWLKQQLEQPGRSQSALARFLKIDASAVNRMTKGERKVQLHEADLIRAYLAGTTKGGGNVTPMQRPEQAQPYLSFLPVRFRVQAGAWLAQDAYAQQDYGVGPIPADPRLAFADQWLEEVGGESVNREIQSGNLVHVVDAVALHYTPRHGDLVVLERTRYDGAEIERSLKFVEVLPSGAVQFVGRSTIEEFNKPLVLSDGDADVTVRIAGWVKNAIKRYG